MQALLDRFAMLAAGGRIADDELARLLGYRDRAPVARIVHRHLREVAALGSIVRVFERGRRRPVYWLTFDQSYAVLTHSRTDAALALRIELIATLLAVGGWPPGGERNGPASPPGPASWPRPESGRPSG